MWKKRRETCELNVDCDVDSDGRISVKRSAKKVGHCSRYVHKKKSVKVCENLLRRTANEASVMHKDNPKDGQGNMEFRHAVMRAPYGNTYTHWSVFKTACCMWPLLEQHTMIKIPGHHIAKLWMKRSTDEEHLQGALDSAAP